jgi:hypothetical protein
MSNPQDPFQSGTQNEGQEFLHSQHELLRSIAASLKGIHNSLNQLTGAVEGVAESIEAAHEPEGDLGTHLVGALKDLTSALHKRAAQERNPQSQQGPRQQHLNPKQHRHEDRPQLRRTDHPDREAIHESEFSKESVDHEAADHEDHGRKDLDEPTQASFESQKPEALRNRKPRPKRRRGNNVPRADKPSGFQDPALTHTPAVSPEA